MVTDFTSLVAIYFSETVKVLNGKDRIITGIGSMVAPGAGAPMKFLSGTHTKSHFALKCFLCYQFSVHII